HAPALEVVLPLPDGLDVWRDLDALAAELGPDYFPAGYVAMVIRGERRLPLAPLPGSPWALLVALRPGAPTLDAARARQARLVPLARRALEAGGRIYIASFALPPDLLRLQLGEAAASLATWKGRVDPRGLCNAGALFGWMPPKD